MLYGARREGMHVKLSVASVCALRPLACIGTAAAVPAVGPATLGARVLVELSFSPATKQLRSGHMRAVDALRWGRVHM